MLSVTVIKIMGKATGEEKDLFDLQVIVHH